MKSLVILAGTVLLVAGCSNGPMSPTAPVRGGAASANVKSKQPKTSTGTTTANQQDADAQGECRSGYVFSGREGDSLCLDDIQY